MAVDRSTYKRLSSIYSCPIDPLCVTDTTGCGICQDYNINYVISYMFYTPSRMHKADCKIIHCQPKKISGMWKMNEEG
jgi:hypothetical protein